MKLTMMSGYAIDSGGVWGTKAQGVTFNGAGASIMTLASGNDYGAEGQYKCTLADIVSSYQVLDNPAEYSVNYLIQGPSGGNNIFEAQAKANKLLSIATTRKDCIACISPYREGVVLSLIHI